MNPTAEDLVAVINAIDAYTIGCRQAADSANTKLLVKSMFEQAGRGDEVASPEWSNPAEVGLMMFRLSLARSGYTLTRSADAA